MKKLAIVLASMLVFSVNLVYAETAQFSNENGYELDDDYYQSQAADQTDFASPLARQATEDVFKRPFKLKVLSKGGFTYNMYVEWRNKDGGRQQYSRENVFALVPLNFTIPAGARNVTLNVTVDDGFFGIALFGVRITPKTVAAGKPDFTEYHLWGTTFWPKWRKMD